MIGFGRRFATYKRAHLLFTDLDRLSKIVNNPDYPVQFLFTGKAHPHDGAGQGLIKRIIEISRRPEFLGKIIFLENYDMQLARRLVSGKAFLHLENMFKCHLSFFHHCMLITQYHYLRQIAYTYLFWNRNHT